MNIVKRLRQHALPDPHDEREVMHAPLLKEAADLIEQQAERGKDKIGEELTFERTEMDDLTKALMLAGEELALEHSWCFDVDPGCPPLDDNPFITVVRKHVEPMVDAEGWRSARIAALKAELALLELAAAPKPENSHD